MLRIAGCNKGCLASFPMLCNSLLPVHHLQWGSSSLKARDCGWGLGSSVFLPASPVLGVAVAASSYYSLDKLNTFLFCSSHLSNHSSALYSLYWSSLPEWKVTDRVGFTSRIQTTLSTVISAEKLEEQ